MVPMATKPTIRMVTPITPRTITLRTITIHTRMCMALTVTMTTEQVRMA